MGCFQIKKLVKDQAPSQGAQSVDTASSAHDNANKDFGIYGLPFNQSGGINKEQQPIYQHGTKAAVHAKAKCK